MVTTDRRTQKTLAALHSAFLELLLDREYESLRIEDIVDRANVARSTFYQHFKTKNDLLRASMRTPFTILADVVGSSSDGACTDRVVRLLMHLRANQATARVLWRWPTRQILAEVLAAQIAERLRRIPDTHTLLPAEIIARQIGDSQLALLEYWINARPTCATIAAANALTVGSKALTNALVQLTPPNEI